MNRAFDLSLILKDTVPILPTGFRVRMVEQCLLPQTDEHLLTAVIATPVGDKYTATRITALQVEMAQRLETLCKEFWEQAVNSMYDSVTATLFGEAINWPPYLIDLFKRAQWGPTETILTWEGEMGASTPEGRVKARLNRRLRDLNLIWKYMPVPSGYGMQSLDYLLCVAGHFVAIETKAPGKSPTPRQEQTIAAIKAAGGITFVVDDDESMDACIGSLVILHRVPAQRAV